MKLLSGGKEEENVKKWSSTTIAVANSRFLECMQLQQSHLSLIFHISRIVTKYDNLKC